MTSTGKFTIILACCVLAAGLSPSRGDEPQWTLACRLVADKTARNVGDLLTIEIEEESSAKMDAQHKTDKSTDIGGSASFSHAKIDARDTAWTNASLPSFSVEANRKFEGSGSMENNGSLSGSMTVRVMDVLPNGSLLIEGKRTLVVQNESLTFTLTGSVRSEDVESDNTIKSSRVADLAIRYESNGSIASTQKKGLLSSLVDWINPF